MAGCGMLAIPVFGALILFFSMETYETCLTCLIVGALPAAIAGAIGAAVNGTRQAAAYGAILFGIITGECIWSGLWGSGSVHNHLCALAAGCAMGALASGAGAMVARTVILDTGEHRRWQISLGELLVACTLAALLMKYIPLLK